jgi:Ca2+-binding EF-hand superfamily protein
MYQGFALLAKGKKKISFESLKQISQEVSTLGFGSSSTDAQRQLDEYLSHEELRAMLHVASSAGDGSVSLEDFVKAMLKTNLFR